MKDYLMTSEEVLRSQKSGESGLSSTEAASRLERDGRNKLAEAKKDSMLKKFFDELKEPMLIILMIAAVLSVITSLAAGEVEFTDAIIILVVVVVLVNDRLSPYIIASFVLFPIVYEAFAKGINSVDDSISDSLEIDGGYHKPHNVFKVLLPLSFPYISLTITQTIGLGLKIVMMAELMNGNTSLPGLGNMIKMYQNAGEYNYIYAIATFVIMLTIIIDIGLYFLKKYIANKYSFNKK